jgi:hypothetical protein
MKDQDNKEIRKAVDKINEAYVAFKIGKITELEKDIAIKGYISESLNARVDEIVQEIRNLNGIIYSKYGEHHIRNIENHETITKILNLPSLQITTTR